MVLMIVLGLIFYTPKLDELVELVIDQAAVPEAESVETLAPVVAQVEVDTSTITASVVAAQTNVNPEPFTLAGGPSLSITAPAEVGRFDEDTHRLAGKLLEGAGNGIGDLLGGAFGERLGRAGAQTGSVQFSLIWDNYNDLDLHVVCPSGERIWFQNRRSKSQGELDVDMNAGGRMSLEPVENIFWPTGRAPRGVYKVYVDYYARHDQRTADGKFTLAVKIDNDIQTLTGEVSPANRTVLVGSFVKKYDR
jgi:hypothetical protein